MIAPGTRADALRSLSALLRVIPSAPRALAEWHGHAPSELRDALLTMSRRLSMGAPPDAAVARSKDVFGEDTHALASLISLHLRTGADLAAMVEALASGVERRAGAAETARAACAGAVLSARLVMGLPLVLMLALPGARVPLFDALGVAATAAGLLLALLGARWIKRLLPSPRLLEDPAADAAELVAAALRGGAGLDSALHEVLQGPLARRVPAAAVACRRASLGAPWPAALDGWGDEGLAVLAEVLARAASGGVPVAARLRGFARARRDDALRRLDAATRRAPVLMVLPLVLCVLPSFLLLGLLPFLRGVSFGA